MTFPHAPAQVYQRAQVGTVDRGRLLLLMFDGARKFLALAESGLERGDLVAFGTQLARGQAIIAELLHTLDHEKGGAIAANLERLYRFMLDHLVEANVQKSAAHVGRVNAMLSTIADAYREILRGGLPRLDAA
jgi:flagellar protein FliS